VFSLVIMTEPYASHDASEIELYIPVYMYIQYSWQEIRQLHGHIRCKHTDMANPIYELSNERCSKSSERRVAKFDREACSNEALSYSKELALPGSALIATFIVKDLDRFTWEDLQPDCSADRPVTGPRQSTISATDIVKELFRLKYAHLFHVSRLLYIPSCIISVALRQNLEGGFQAQVCSPSPRVNMAVVYFIISSNHLLHVSRLCCTFHHASSLWPFIKIRKEVFRL